MVPIESTTARKPQRVTSGRGRAPHPAARFDVVLVVTVALTFALGRSADAAVLDDGFLHLHARVIGASSYP